VTNDRPPLLPLSPDAWFVGRRREIDQLVQIGEEAADARRHSTLLVGRRGVGKSEIIRRAYAELFWKQTHVVPICLTLTRESTDVVSFAQQWFATFVRQWIGFRRRDAALVADTAMPFRRALRLAHESGEAALVQLAENFEECRRDEDWIALLRNSAGASGLVAQATGAPIFTMVDEFQRIDHLRVGDQAASLGGLFRSLLESHAAPHLIAGSSQRVIERLLGADLLGRRVERLRIEPLPPRSTIRLWETACRRSGVACNLDLGLEVAEQTEGIPLYVLALVRAAASQAASLTTARALQGVYAHDVLGGDISAQWHAVFNDAVPDVANRRVALEVLRHLYEEAPLRPLRWHRLLSLTDVAEDALQRVVEQLERGGLLEVGHSQIRPILDGVLRDWARMAARREDTGARASVLMQALVHERLLWTAKSRERRARRQIVNKAEALLGTWDCQSVPPALLQWSAFKRLRKKGTVEEIAAAFEKKPATLALPQIVGVTALDDAQSGASTLAAFGFEEARHAPGWECVVVVQMHLDAEPVNATQVEAFLSLTERHAETTGIARVHRWMISKSGFTDEAVELLEESETWTSDVTQFQLLLRRFRVPTDDAAIAEATAGGMGAALTLGEFALAIPMAKDTELVAASTVEQIATQAGFPEAARGQIKMAVIEACINAREHSGEAGAVTLLVRPGDTQLEIVVENPGLVFDPQAVEEPVLEEKMGKGKSLRDKRGWGLKLMRTLMDEVVFEPSDEGTRVRLVKHRAAAADVADAGKD
jgi:anti-sigma regulatory factor (Ser/Thr protein kinase)